LFLSAKNALTSRSLSLSLQVNYNLMTVNFVMGLTAFYQLYRVASHHQAKEQQKSVDK